MFNVSTRRFLFYLGLLYIAVRLDLAHADAANDYSYWQNTQGSVQTTNGKTAKLYNISDYNKATQQAVGQFEVIDQDGNKKNVSKTLKLNPSKFKSYALSCFRGPAACLASAAIGYAVTELALWAINDNNTVTYETTLPATAYDQWPACKPTTVKREEITEGKFGNSYDFDISCVAQVRADGDLVLRVEYPQKPSMLTDGTILYNEDGTPESDSTWNPPVSELTEYYTPIHLESEWSWVPLNHVSFRRQPTIDSCVNDGCTSIRMNYATLANLTVPPTPPVVTTNQEVTPELFAQNVPSIETLQATNPQTVPNVWEPVDFGTDIPVASDSTAPQEPEQPPVEDAQQSPSIEWAFGNPEHTPLSTISDMNSIERSIVPFFTTEEMFDARCPEPISVELPIHGEFQISFQAFCDISTIVKPIVVLSGMLIWLVIVWRGLHA